MNVINKLFSNLLKPSVVIRRTHHISVRQVPSTYSVPVYVKVGKVRMKASEKHFYKNALGLNV